MNREQLKYLNLTMPAEWEDQEAVLMAFPHENTDWGAYLDDARRQFARIIAELTWHGDKVILLAKNATSPWKHYGLVAGYVEVGETLEQAVRREVMEEVGLPVRDLRYIGSQPWGVCGSLMCAFQGETDSSLPLKIQRSELADAKWVSRDQLAAPERTVSVALEMIERFRQGRL